MKLEQLVLGGDFLILNYHFQDPPSVSSSKYGFFQSRTNILKYICINILVEQKCEQENEHSHHATFGSSNTSDREKDKMVRTEICIMLFNASRMERSLKRGRMYHEVFIEKEIWENDGRECGKLLFLSLFPILHFGRKTQTLIRHPLPLPRKNFPCACDCLSQSVAPHSPPTFTCCLLKQIKQ